VISVKFSFEKHITVPENVLFRKIDDEAVILNIDSENYYGLDDMGARMWSLLTTSDTIQTAYDALLAQYEVEPERLEADLHKLIATLVEKKLIEIADEEGK
jgi:hypothetical protein